MTARPSLNHFCDLPNRDSWPSTYLPPPRISRANVSRNVHAELEAQAARTAFRVIKERARAYIDKPWQLDMIRRGFVMSLMTPQQRIMLCKQILYEETRTRAVFALVPVRLFNVRAAILAGRYSRAQAHQAARRVA